MDDVMLEPCPVCRKPARATSDGSGWPLVVCEPCGLYMEALNGADDPVPRWNRRAPDARTEALVEAMRSILNDMPIIDCDRLHHSKNDRHGAGPCLVEARLEGAISRARSALALHRKKESHDAG